MYVFPNVLLSTLRFYSPVNFSLNPPGGWKGGVLSHSHALIASTTLFDLYFHRLIKISD